MLRRAIRSVVHASGKVHALSKREDRQIDRHLPFHDVLVGRFRISKFMEPNEQVCFNGQVDSCLNENS